MSEDMSNFTPPQWISSRVYSLFDKGNGYFKAYISNERTHEYMSFQGNAAELWKFVVNDDFSGLNLYAKENDLYDELPLFFEELKKMGLLVDNQENTEKSYFYENTIIKNLENEEVVFLEKMEDEIAKNGYLPALFIELTNKCNLKCVHCYQEKNNTYNQIKFEDIKQTIDQAVELGVYRITLSGGECTINNDFLKIVEYIRKKKISFAIFTNGQKFYDEPDFLEKFLALYPNKVYLSLYSMDEATHDKVTGVVGSHKKTMTIIKYLRERNVEVGIKCFLTRYNYKDYKAIEKFAEEIKVSVTFDMTLFLSETRCNEEAGLLPEEIKTLYTNTDSPFIERVNKRIKIDEQFLNNLVCKGGHYFMRIAPDLTVYPCASVKAKFGNLKENSLYSIWKCKDENSPLKRFQSLRKRDLQECYKEEYCGYCSYCMGMAEVENGFLKKSDVCCTHAKLKYEVNNHKEG